MGGSGQPNRQTGPDAADGIPDRAAHRPLWKYALVAVAFVAWLAVLAGLHVAARR